MRVEKKRNGGEKMSKVQLYQQRAAHTHTQREKKSVASERKLQVKIGRKTNRPINKRKIRNNSRSSVVYMKSQGGMGVVVSTWGWTGEREREWKTNQNDSVKGTNGNMKEDNKAKDNKQWLKRLGNNKQADWIKMERKDKQGGKWGKTNWQSKRVERNKR